MRAITATITIAAIAMAAFVCSPSRAEETLNPGAYAVDVHLEMALSEDKPERRTVCLTEAGGKPAHGLFILTPGTPISNCPVENVRHLVGRIAFEIVCKGPNSGFGTAEYRTFDDRFEGRIAMLMGGKNMRMTEVQVGRRVGACASDAAGPSSQ